MRALHVARPAPPPGGAGARHPAASSLTLRAHAMRSVLRSVLGTALRTAGALLGTTILAGTAAAQGGIVDGTSNTIVVDERPLAGTTCTRVTTRGNAGAAIWTSIYLRPIAGSCGLPIATAPCPVARQPITRVLDGTSNTIYVSESPGTWCVGNIGNGQCAVQSLSSITDGTSNTILLGELLPPIGGAEPLECSLPVRGSACALGGFGTITDGTSNTITIGVSGAGYGCLIPVAGTRDLPDVRVAPGGGLCTTTPGGIVDGTSNTIFVGECAAAVATPEPSAIVLLGAGLTALAGIAGRRRRA